MNLGFVTDCVFQAWPSGYILSHILFSLSDPDIPPSEEQGLRLLALKLGTAVTMVERRVRDTSYMGKNTPPVVFYFTIHIEQFTSDTSSHQMCGGFLPPTTSLTPDKYLLTYLNSDTIYLKIVSDPTS